MSAPQTNPNWVLKIPPPVWALAMLAAAFAIDRVTESAIVFRSSALALLFGVGGFALASWGRVTFAKEDTEIIPTSASNKKLVMRGPFRFSRNPMYAGLVLLTLGIAFYAGTLPFYAVPILLFILCNFVFIPYEEAKMQRQFDAQYTDYLRRVRRWV
jgi:protein-S-isoprenylcysteine O-methyltransferase Ste14